MPWNAKWLICKWILQIKGNVSNGLAEVNVLWNITVKNENDYPSFGKQLFEETIPEDSDPGLILKLDLSDPDDTTSEERFHIVNVTAVCKYFNLYHVRIQRVGQGVETPWKVTKV